MDYFGVSIVDLLRTIGLVGIWGIVFVESGLLVGFFLPGDSLLFVAGLLASQGYLNLPALIIGSILAAILGDNVGYQLGRKFGPRIFNRPDSFFFHQNHRQRAERFYAAHGPITVVLARFVPFIRAFAPILAGVGQMPYRRFFCYNVLGGVLWVLSMTLLGYFLGTVIADIDRYILPIVGLIIVLSVLPILVTFLKRSRSTD